MDYRICSKCGKVMYDGYVIENGMEYYCDDICLYSELTKEEYFELYEGGSSYWTEFWGS